MMLKAKSMRRMIRSIGSMKDAKIIRDKANSDRMAMMIMNSSQDVFTTAASKSVAITM
jgi:hypothetical protein